MNNEINRIVKGNCSFSIFDLILSEEELILKSWTGAPPKKCETCQRLIVKSFVDGKTRNGYWAIMCPDCVPSFGVGLGLGKGQKYTKNKAGNWIKDEKTVKGKAFTFSEDN
jgi:hypothetical protein